MFKKQGGSVDVVSPLELPIERWAQT